LLFVQICVIVALSRLVGFLALRVGQPRVVGEMLAGILLGPSLLGWVAPHFYSHVLFPPDSWPFLNFLSQLGVVCFLFLVGLELDPKLLRDRGHAAIMISHMSIVVPFLLGAALALFLFPRVFNDTPAMSFRAVALFMGAAMSITAFPVLARILTERNLHKTNIGAVAITCAAVDDVTAWCMLAFVVAFAQFKGIGQAMNTALLSGAYVLLMFFVVRPFVRKLENVYEREGRLNQTVVAIVLLLALSSACVTEWIGIHALFGAFLMGCMMPKGSRFVRDLSEKLEDYTVILLLPIFFAYSGLRTRIGLLNNADLWLDTVLVIVVACAGKFGGSAVAARVCGIGWREASALGILMNTRGLMELVILNIGRDLGVISDAVFAMMILMALATTAMTQPVLNAIYPARLLRAQLAARPKRFSVLIPVSLPASATRLVRLAGLLLGKDRQGQVYALHLQRPVEHDAYRGALGEATPVESEAVEAARAEAAERGVPLEVVAFPTRDVSGDIVNTAADRNVDLVLMGFHKPVFGRALLGGKVHQVMSASPCDVAVFIDRGLTDVDRVLVPYLGTAHDRLALELGARIARSSDAMVTVVQVTAPGRATPSRRAEIERATHRLSDRVTLAAVEDASPASVVLRESPKFDLTIIGVAEEWGLESRLFGWRPERIARESSTSLLIVRKDESLPAAADATEVEAPLPAAVG
jgi:Kef-type K+ transport system membrane component KefB/nucleotide-binding universal stress UspA family protein